MVDGGGRGPTAVCLVVCNLEAAPVDVVVLAPPEEEAGEVGQGPLLVEAPRHARLPVVCHEHLATGGVLCCRTGLL